jgi:MFS family permease
MSQAVQEALHPEVLHRTVSLSYTQAVLSAIFTASTGGLFLTGYALKLGAGDVQIGLMTTLPMFCVAAQLVSAYFVEQGRSRRKLSAVAGFLNVAGWGLAVAIPYAIPESLPSLRLTALIALVTLMAVFTHISGNARSSWVGDLIPETMRGSFFGRIAMFTGIIGTVFVLGEGVFLDNIRQKGLEAFSWLFGFGMIFGVINAALFLPQPEMPLVRHEKDHSFLKLVGETFRNRPLRSLILFASVWGLQSLAGPFWAVYQLRDLKMPFFGVGLTSSVLTLTALLFAPFWGRIVDRYGCRPVLLLCTFVWGLCPLVWLPVDSPTLVYCLIAPHHIIVGFMFAGFSVAMATLIYKVTPVQGRSVQMAIYAILVTLIPAPMPTLGGCIMNWLHSMGFNVDLRVLFETTIVFAMLAVLAGRRIREDGARSVSTLVRHLPMRLAEQFHLRRKTARA